MEIALRVRNFAVRVAGVFQRLSPVRRVQFAFLVAAFGTILYLLFAPKPWLLDWTGRSSGFVEYCTLYYSWWGGLVALLGSLLLTATAGWWMRPLPAAPLAVREAAQQDAARCPPRWFWPLVGAAMMLTAAMGAQRLPMSFWDDEHYTARRFVSGAFRQTDDGGVRFRERGWRYAFHDYRMPNNHILHSLLAQGTLRFWRIFRDRKGLPYSEAVMRLPAFLFGILSVASLAWLLKEFGMARAGVLAAFLLALHPWHIRYASEARGYSLVLFLLPVLLVCWTRALRSGLWRWWMAAGAAQFALLYTYPATLYPVAMLNLATLVLLLGRYPRSWSPAIPLARWWVTGTVSALAFIWLFLPCVPQLQNYLRSDVATGTMTMGWWKDFGAHLFAGVTWFRSGDLQSPQPELLAMAAARPALYATVLWSVVLLAVAGLVRWGSRGWLAAVAAAVFFVPAMLAWWVTARGGNFLYAWYLIYVLPGAVAAVAIGIDSLGLWSRQAALRAAVPTAACLLLVAAYLTVVSDAPRWLLTKPIQPLREAALAARGTVEPNHEGHDKVITAALINPLYYYDPHHILLENMESLLALVGEAEEKGKDFFVHIGIPGVAKRDQPEIYHLLTASGSFETVAWLSGFDPTLDRVVVRYRPGTLAAGRVSEAR